MRQRVKDIPKWRFVWCDGDMECQKSFVRYLQVFKDQITIMIGSTALVAYLVHVDSANFSVEYRLWLLETVKTAFGFQLFRVGTDLKDSCSIHGGRSSVPWFTCIEDVPVEEVLQFS